MHSPEIQNIIVKERQQRLLRDAEVQKLIDEARRQRSRYIMAKLYALIQGMASKKRPFRQKSKPAHKPM